MKATTRSVWLMRVWLWLRIVGRTHWADKHYGPVLAWQTAKIIWPKGGKNAQRDDKR